MTLDLATCELLLGRTGSAAIAAAAEFAPTEANYLTCTERLRKHFSPELARAALDTLLLRQKAAGKFSNAAQLFFTRESLEVSSGEVISNYRAARYAAYETVSDFCCGIGADTMALARSGRRVEAVDNDPVRVRLAQANMDILGLSSRAKIKLGDVLRDPLPIADAAFADPGRRAGGRRFLSPGEYQPPPAEILRRLPAHFPIAFKLAPGTAWNDLHDFDAEIEFISVNGELKECIAWHGPLQTFFGSGVVHSPTVTRRATLLPGGHTLASDTTPTFVDEPTALEEYLYDPDSAVTRAGLVPILAQQLGAFPIDHTAQLLTSSQYTPTPFATVYRVDCVLKWDARAISAHLRSVKIGRVTPVQRGAPDAEKLLKAVKCEGDGHRFLIVTRLLNSPCVVVAERVTWTLPTITLR